MTQFINLDELDARIKALNKPTPQQVVNLIMAMYTELRSDDHYTQTYTRPYANR